MISVLLTLLRFALWPRMWSVLGNISRELEQDVYSAVIG